MNKSDLQPSKGTIIKRKNQGGTLIQVTMGCHHNKEFDFSQCLLIREVKGQLRVSITGKDLLTIMGDQ